LRGANLRDADLRVKTPSPTDHYFVSEILKRAADGDYKKLAFAGFVRINLDFCWHNINEWDIPKIMLDWFKEVMCEKWPKEFGAKFKEIGM